MVSKAQLNLAYRGGSKTLAIFSPACVPNHCMNQDKTMKPQLLASLICLTATTAMAQTPDPHALNLAIPSSPIEQSGHDLASDPPGTYYGDVGGDQKADNGVQMSGALSTTIGYAKGFGTGISNSADLKLLKQTDEGKTFSLQLHVTEGDALPYQGRYYRRGW